MAPAYIMRREHLRVFIFGLFILTAVPSEGNVTESKLCMGTMPVGAGQALLALVRTIVDIDCDAVAFFSYDDPVPG